MYGGIIDMEGVKFDVVYMWSRYGFSFHSILLVADVPVPSKQGNGTIVFTVELREFVPSHIYVHFYTVYRCSMRILNIKVLCGEGWHVR